MESRFWPSFELIYVKILNTYILATSMLRGLEVVSQYGKKMYFSELQFMTKWVNSCSFKDKILNIFVDFTDLVFLYLRGPNVFRRSEVLTEVRRL